MRIVIVSRRTFPYYGGVERYVYNFLRALSNIHLPTNIQITLIIIKGRIEHLLKPHNYELKILRCPLLYNINEFYIATLTDNIKTEIKKADLVHVHGLYYLPALSILRYLLRLEKPNNESPKLLYQIHGMIFNNTNINIYVRLGVKTFLRMMGSYYLKIQKRYGAVLSFKMVNEFVEIFRENPHFIIPNYIYVEDFKYNEEKHYNKQLNILFVGDNVSWKNPKDYIKLAYRLRHINGLKFYIIGKGYNPHMLAKYNVTYLGSVNPLLMPKIYERTNILVVTSHSEGMPTVILEAMASGVIPLSYNVGAVSDVIIHGVNGFIVSLGNVRDIIKYIITLLSNRELLYSMAYQARKTVEEHFNSKIIARKIYNIYKLLSEG